MLLFRSLFTVKSSSRLILTTNCKSASRLLQTTKLKYSTTSSQDPGPPDGKVSSSNKNTTRWTANHSKIHLRLARENDYQDVRRVSEGIYEGDDYLSSRFHEWLKTPNKLIFVAELEGKVIALSVAYIVSGGRTCFAQATRIHQDYRGRGFSYPLMMGTTDYVRQMYPQVTKKHGIFSETFSSGQMFRILKTLGSKPIMSQRMYYFKIKDVAGFPEELFHRYRTIVEERDINLHEYTVRDAQRIITSYPVALDSIAPQKVMIREWEAYEALPSNIDYIFIENDKMFAEVSKEDLEGGKIPLSFSHGSKFLPDHAVHWMCVISTNDLFFFRAHFLEQIKSAREIIGKEFDVWVIVCSKSSSFAMDAKKVLEEELTTLQQGTTVGSDMLYLFEQVFDN